VKIARALGVLVAVLLALGVFYLVLVESAEVVVLETRDASGSSQQTRLWVVDHEGFAWLRTGNVEAPWLLRLRAQPEVLVTREGVQQPYRAVPVEEQATRERINALVLQKYGWRESTLRAFGMDPAGAIPMRLEPAS
jgi:hypothetical protein